MYKFNCNVDSTVVRQFVAHLMVANKPFTIRFPGNTVEFEVETEADVPAAMSNYVVKVALNGKK